MEEQIQPTELAPRPRKRRRSGAAEPAIEQTAEVIIAKEPEPEPDPAQIALPRTQLIRPMPRVAAVQRRGVKSATDVSR